MSTMTKDGYAEITAKVVEALERGVVPWQRPWRHVTGAGIGSANLRSKRPYRGINVLLLAIAEAANGYERPWWVTFKQAKELGGSVRRGEKGTSIYFFKPIVVEDEETGKKKTIPLLRSFTVFNVDQCDGLEAKVPAPVETETTRVERIDQAERIVAGFLAAGGPSYSERPSDRAYYSPGADAVVVPERDQFVNGETFYSTVFHELAHSTGHKSRLDREELGGSFGSKPYAREELVAELGASFLRGEAGINGEAELDQSAAYIASWLKSLADDPKLVVWAAGRAQKAADLILGRKVEAAEG